MVGSIKIFSILLGCEIGTSNNTSIGSASYRIFFCCILI